MIQDLTVIIVTYKTNLKILCDCIESIDKEVKILIIENSNDLNFKKNLETDYKNVDVILSGKNLGYGAGNNLGFKNISTRYGLISNPDIIYDKNFFKNIINYTSGKIKFSIIGVSYFDDEINLPYGSFDNKKDYKLKMQDYNLYNLKEVDWVVGCSLLLDTKNLDKHDLFDENYFLYFEEIDLCRKIKSKYGNIFNSSILKVKHLGHQGSAATDPSYSIETEMFRNWHWMWSSFYYKKKYNNYFIALFSMLGKLIRSFAKMIFFTLFYNKNKQTMYYARFSGLINSIIGKKSWYRVKSLFD